MVFWDTNQNEFFCFSFPQGAFSNQQNIYRFFSHTKLFFTNKDYVFTIKNETLPTIIEILARQFAFSSANMEFSPTQMWFYIPKASQSKLPFFTPKKKWSIQITVLSVSLRTLGIFRVNMAEFMWTYGDYTVEQLGKGGEGINTLGIPEMSLAQNGAMVIRPINKKGYSRKGDFINKNLGKWTIEASPRIMRWLEVFSICAELMVSKTWLDSKVYLRKISLNSNLRHWNCHGHWEFAQRPEMILMARSTSEVVMISPGLFLDFLGCSRISNLLWLKFITPILDGLIFTVILPDTLL